MKYLLVDKHQQFRTFLREFISRDEDAFMELEDDSSIGPVYAQFKPDWVVMDARIAAQGFRMMERFKRQFPNARLILIADDPDEKCRAKAVEAGGEAVISKENLFELEKLIHSKDIF